MPVYEDGKVYHLGLGPEDNLPQNIFLVGDPSRVFKVAKYFDSEPVIRKNLQFITAIGSHQGLPIAVIGTGIGPAATEIVANELHILNEYDHLTKKWKQPVRRLNVIRLGTYATLQKNIPVGSLAISWLAIELDNLNGYHPFCSSHYLVTAIAKKIDDILGRLDNLSNYASKSSYGMEYFLTSGNISV